jgi:hypothetical protein
MRDFFDPKSYVASPLKDGECGGCGRTADDCLPTAAARKHIHDMIGLVWPPDLAFMGLPLRRDFATLGLDQSTVPDSISLCADCCAAYMEDFNKRLARVGA